MKDEPPIVARIVLVFLSGYLVEFVFNQVVKIVPTPRFNISVLDKVAYGCLFIFVGWYFWRFWDHLF